MTPNGSSTTIAQRVHECLALAACASGADRERYLAEAEGLKQVAAGQPANVHQFQDTDRQAAYERGRSDGLTLLKIHRGGPSHERTP